MPINRSHYLLTWTWRLTDVVYKFLYSTFDKSLYRYPSREIHEFMSLFTKFIDAYVCWHLSRCQKFWQSYCRNKTVQFWGNTVYVINTCPVAMFVQKSIWSSVLHASDVSPPSTSFNSPSSTRPHKLPYSTSGRSGRLTSTMREKSPPPPVYL